MAICTSDHHRCFGHGFNSLVKLKYNPPKAEPNTKPTPL